MLDNSLWGDLSELSPERTPSLILQEQANFLRGATRDLLIGNVRRHISGTGSTISASLRIVAPALQNYSLEILELSYDASMLYPVRIRNLFSDNPGMASSEDELKEELGKILTSDQVRTVIANLIAESQP